MVIGQVAAIENRPGSRVIAVNLYVGFSVRLNTYDSVHPNELGEQKIANRFHNFSGELPIIQSKTLEVVHLKKFRAAQDDKIGWCP